MGGRPINLVTGVSYGMPITESEFGEPMTPNDLSGEPAIIVSSGGHPAKLINDDFSAYVAIAPFIMTVETTGAAETFTIPCQNVGTFDAVVDWGDDSTSEITAYNDADLSHEYATADTYTITISGTFPNIYFNNTGDKLKLRTVEQLGEVGWSVLNKAFMGCSSMTAFTAGPCDTSNVTTLAQMFQATTVAAPDVTGMDVSSVTAMTYLFYTCSSLTTLDVSSWDTSSLLTIGYAFSGCTSLTSLDVSGWDTSLISNMSNAFRNCSSLAALDVSTWNTSGVLYLPWTFANCANLTDIRIDLWDIESVTDFSNMMNGSSGMSTARYDATLIAWDAQTPLNTKAVHFGSSTYTGGGAAATARANLIADHTWTITDGGIA